MCKTFYVFNVLCLYKTGNFDIIIKISSFRFLRYDLFDLLLEVFVVFLLA